MGWRRPNTRESLMTVLIASSLMLAAWTAYLAWHLPVHYRASHWDAAWVGVDVAQVAMLLGTAWAAWRRRVIIVLFAVGAAMLFVTDAWFDIMTAHGADLWRSLASAVLIELPSALVLFYVGRRAVQNVANEWWQLLFGRNAPPPSKLTMRSFERERGREVPLD